jgi:hypothetical protein
LESLAVSVLGRATDVANELRIFVISEAEADREEIRRVVARTIEAAQVRSAEILAEAKREVDNMAQLVDDAGKQVDLFLQHGKAMARERARSRWERAAGARAEISLELQRLDHERETVHRKLTQSQESVAASLKILDERRTQSAD